MWQRKATIRWIGEAYRATQVLVNSGETELTSCRHRRVAEHADEAQSLIFQLGHR